MVVLQLLSVAAVVCFVVVVLAKALMYARTPIHMRWELYPVAHDEGYAHGGSYYENSEWWTKEIKPNKLAELGVMASEILLLKGVQEHNKPMWYWSLPFHLGVYAMFGFFFWLVVGGVLGAVGLGGTPVLTPAIHWLTQICGYAGIVLTPIGAIGLLVRRSTDPDLKRMSAPIDYFNLVFFVALAGVAVAARFVVDTNFGHASVFVHSLLTASSPAMPLPTLFIIEVVLWSLMLVYMPLTRMNHFVAKYFAYHQIRWDDEPNRRGSRLEARVKEALGFGVAWSAPHIQTGKTWAEVATELPKEESSK
jgi:nitrate reductase gamma subunit